MKYIKLTLIIVFSLNYSSASDLDNFRHWIQIDWANDFVFQTDRYYTNGMSVSYYNQSMVHSFINYIHLPNRDDENTFYGLHLNQDIFTPINKDAVVYNGYDRPFSSYLLIGSSKIITNRKVHLVRESRFQIGLLGKYGGGEWVQNGIHSVLPTSAVVEGWTNQMQTDLAISYYLSFEKGLITSQSVQLGGVLEGQLGVPDTYLASGLRFRTGKVDKYYHSLNFTKSNEFEFYFYSDLTGKFVAYNATIQGGIFNKSSDLNYPQLQPLVFTMDTGINMGYSSIILRLGAKLISPEFKQGQPHRWGYVSITFGF